MPQAELNWALIKRGAQNRQSTVANRNRNFALRRDEKIF